ncbi:MAG: CoA transferase subunit A [Syntrophobacteraceae bacterium]
MSIDKTCSLKEAVSTYISDGDTVALGGFLARVPMGAVFEVIRQRKKELTLIVDSGVEPVDFLIGAGLVKKVESAWVWIAVANAFNFRRAVEKGVPRRIEVEDYSNLAIGMRYLAGALGVPFMPLKSFLGTDIPVHNKKIKITPDPYSGEPVALVPAANPDVALIHVQRADKMGNAQVWGILGNEMNIARAARKVVLTCEEIVPTSELRKIPNMTHIPYYCVSAVVELPFGSYPAGTPCYYWVDTPCRRRWAMASKTREGFIDLLDDILCDNHNDFLRKIGNERLAKLRKMEHDNNRIPILLER